MVNLVSAFASKANCIANKLINKVKIISGEKNLEVYALWDTGATGTCISENVQRDLGLVAISRQKICTPSSTIEVDVCLVDVELPNKVLMRDVPVAVTKIGDQGIGMLIGMNIISKGDFAVSNFNNHTVFTFRVPSQKTTDYVAETNLQKIVGTHGKGKRKHKRK